MSVSLGELAVRFGCELRGDPDARIERVATLAGADQRALAFLANPRYRAQLAATHAAAVVLSPADADAGACRTALLLCENPYATYARIAAVLYPTPPLGPVCIRARWWLPAPASIRAPRCAPWRAWARTCASGRARWSGRTAAWRRTSRSPPTCASRRTSRSGAGCSIGARTVLQPGAVIGGDGFGFAPDDGGWVKVPQLGTVRIGADVEIGANTTIDRGAIDDTVIEEGVKLDNLILIGHNVHIGAHTAHRRLHRRLRQHHHRQALHDRRRGRHRRPHQHRR